MLEQVRYSSRVGSATGAALYVLATLQYAFAQIVTAAAWNPPYDWAKNYISDLGNTGCATFSLPHGEPRFVCSPLNAVMNFSFIISGILIIAGTLSLWNFWSTRKIAITAQVLWVISGVGKMVVGLIPENTDTGLHIAAAINIPVANIAILLLSVAIFSERRMLALIGIIFFVLSSIALLLSVAALFGRPALLLGLGVGGMERLSGYPASVWLLLAGILVCASSVRPQQSSPRSGVPKRSI